MSWSKSPKSGLITHFLSLLACSFSLDLIGHHGESTIKVLGGGYLDLAIMRHVNNVARRFPCSACPPTLDSLVGKIEGRRKKKWRWSSGRWPSCWSDGSVGAARRGSRCWWAIVRIPLSIQYQVNPALVSPTQILFSWSVTIAKFHNILKPVEYDAGEAQGKVFWLIYIYISAVHSKKNSI